MTNAVEKMLLVIHCLYYVLILLITAAPLATTQLECSPGKQQVISYNKSLISPDNVTATNQDVNFNPDDYLFHRNNIPLRLWCTESLSNGTNISEEVETVTLIDYLLSRGGQNRNDEGYSINVSLSRLLLITQIGSSGFSNGFINNFTVMYATDENNFITYQQLGEKEEFIVSKIDTVFSLKRPFPALWLRFQINDGIISPSGRLCWHLTLFGCPIEEAITKEQAETENTSSQPIATPTFITSPTQVTPTFITSHTQATPTFITSHTQATPTLPTQACPPLTQASSSPFILTTQLSSYNSSNGILVTPSPQTVVVRDYQILIIVVPAVVVTVMLVVCVVAIGVCICLRHNDNDGWRSQKDDFRSSDTLTNSTNTLRIVENGTLYKSSSPLLSLTTAEGRGISEQRDDILDLNKPIYENCARETIPSNKESGYYEPVNPISDDDSLQSTDSMVDNPTYSVPFPVGQPRPLLGHPRPPLPPIPVESSPLSSGVQAGTRHEGEGTSGDINMVDNECYRAPGSAEENEISFSQSFSNRLPNDYETPL